MNDDTRRSAARVGFRRIEIEIPEDTAVAMEQIVEPCSPILEYKNLSELVRAILKESQLLTFLTDFRRELIELRIALWSASKESEAKNKVAGSSGARQLPIDLWSAHRSVQPSEEEFVAQLNGRERPKVRSRSSDDGFHTGPQDGEHDRVHGRRGLAPDGREPVHGGRQVVHDGREAEHDGQDLPNGGSGIIVGPGKQRGADSAATPGPVRLGRMHEIGLRCSEVAEIIERCLWGDDHG